MIEEDFNDENIRKIIDVNEIKTQISSPFIAAVEQCLSKPANNMLTRDKWYQTYSLTDTYVRGNEKVRTKSDAYEIGDEISSIEAVNDPGLLADSRPRFFDNLTKTWSLLDSGSCISCIPKGPNDKMDANFKLRAVNGQCIPTFGSEVVKIRIGRKTYEIEAVKKSGSRIR